MGDYQFYQINSEGKPAEEVQAPRPHRSPVLPWVFLVVVIVLLVGAMVFAANVIKESGWKADRENTVETRLEEKVTECLEDGGEEDECLNSAQTDVADELGDARLCKGLDGGAKVNCVTVIAFEALDPNVCSVLSGTEKSDCEDLIHAVVARSENKIDLCQKIENEERRNVCISDFGVTSEALTIAIGSNDPASCQSLSTEGERMACIDEYQAIDTDGDGYSDYEEVQNGFSPTE